MQSVEVVDGVFRQYTVTQDGPWGLPEVRIEVHYEVLGTLCNTSFIRPCDQVGVVGRGSGPTEVREDEWYEVH